MSAVDRLTDKESVALLRAVDQGQRAWGLAIAPVARVVERIVADRLRLARERAAEAEAENAELSARVADYQHRITWDTTCGNCANLLDKSYEDYVRAAKAEAENAELRARIERVEALADKWASYPRGTNQGVGFSAADIRAALGGDG